MAFPCNNLPKQFVDCCTVMDCINIGSADNSVTVTKDGCGVDLSITANNLFDLITINDSDCITVVKEVIDGVLNFTPVLDLDCVKAGIADDICATCADTNPPPCPAPIQLSILVV